MSSRYPYPTYGGVGPAAGGLKGTRRLSYDPNLVGHRPDSRVQRGYCKGLTKDNYRLYSRCVYTRAHAHRGTRRWGGAVRGPRPHVLCAVWALKHVSQHTQAAHGLQTTVHTVTDDRTARPHGDTGRKGAHSRTHTHSHIQLYTTHTHTNVILKHTHSTVTDVTA